MCNTKQEKPGSYWWHIKNETVYIMAKSTASI